eukprot:scaffold7410_cov169-Ochromonas_danica.AAC.4
MGSSLLNGLMLTGLLSLLLWVFLLFHHDSLTSLTAPNKFLLQTSPSSHIRHRTDAEGERTPSIQFHESSEIFTQVEQKSRHEGEEPNILADGSAPGQKEVTVKRGVLTCQGKQVDSEIIYWRRRSDDEVFESPISPHHGQHDDRSAPPSSSCHHHHHHHYHHHHHHHHHHNHAFLLLIACDLILL